MNATHFRLVLSGAVLAIGVAGTSAVAQPAGGACDAELGRFQALLKSDLDTGNLNQSVFDQMQRELAGATRACQDGHDREAVGLIRATKARHGYRAGS